MKSRGSDERPNSDYSLWFTKSVIKQFRDKLNWKSNEEKDCILPTDFFEVKRRLILIDAPHYEKNETSSKYFLKKIHWLTNNLYEDKIKWITKNVRNLFRWNSKNPHPASVINKGICTCQKQPPQVFYEKRCS